MKKYFENYIQFREAINVEPGDGGIVSKIKLIKKEGTKEFAPFTISRDQRPNLRVIVKAFLLSPQVGLGYTTLDKSKGEIEPQLKKKSLYLTGGAVRDHLKGKTPKGYDLVTDATPSEIRLILTFPENRFIEVKPESPEYKEHKDYRNLPEAGTKNKVFYASRWDKQGKEIEFMVSVNQEKFYLATMSKSSKSRMFVPATAEAAGSIEDDSANRDFTINSMYIPLNNPDGENTELIDIYGGAHDLKSANLKAVNDKMDDRIEEDPATALRYMKLAPRFGNPNRVEDKIKRAVQSGKFATIPKNVIHKEFISGLEHPDCDTRKYLKMLHNHGMLQSIVPEAQYDLSDMPTNLKGDRWITMAWILRNNEPESIKEILMQNGWNKAEAHDIAYLIKMYQWAKNQFDPHAFHDIKNSHTGLTKSKIKDFLKMGNLSCPASDSFFDHEDSDLSPYITQDTGKRMINPAYVEFIGRMPNPSELESVKKALSTLRWLDMFR
jgi:tRNA nucleotidyltransferase/poly(A) polymerase